MLAILGSVAFEIALESVPEKLLSPVRILRTILSNSVNILARSSRSGS